MGKSAPAAPDPIETANAQGAANIKGAQESARLNRYATQGPSGSTTWGNPDEYGVPQTQVTSLNKPEQYLYDKGIATATTAGNKAFDLLSGLNFNGTSITGLPQLSTDFGKDAQDAETAVYNRYARTLDPEQAAQSRANETKLATSGLPVGSEAWVTAMNRLDRSQAGTRQDARDASVAAGNALQAQRFGESSQARSQAYSEFTNTLAQLLGASTGQIVQPGAPSTAQMQVAPADITGPTQAGYNAKVANTQSNNQSTGQALAAVASIAAMY